MGDGEEAKSLVPALSTTNARFGTHIRSDASTRGAEIGYRASFSHPSEKKGAHATSLPCEISLVNNMKREMAGMQEYPVGLSISTFRSHSRTEAVEMGITIDSSVTKSSHGTSTRFNAKNVQSNDCEIPGKDPFDRPIFGMVYCPVGADHEEASTVDQPSCLLVPGEIFQDLGLHACDSPIPVTAHASQSHPAKSRIDHLFRVRYIVLLFEVIDVRSEGYPWKTATSLNTPSTPSSFRVFSCGGKGR